MYLEVILRLGRPTHIGNHVGLFICEYLELQIYTYMYIHILSYSYISYLHIHIHMYACVSTYIYTLADMQISSLLPASPNLRLRAVLPMQREGRGADRRVSDSAAGLGSMSITRVT